MLAVDAEGALTLTAAGTSQGFSLTTFATGFPNSPASGNGNAGPLGIAFTSSGGVLVADLPGNVRLFPTDTDGQNAGSVTPGANYGSDNALGLARVGSTFYMTEQNAGRVVQINSDGTPTANTILTGLNSPNGLVANPTNGHLFVDDPGNGRILDLNPITKTFTVLASNVFGDGLTTDGTTVYVATVNKIFGYRISDGTLTYTSPTITVANGGSLDGTSLGFGSLAGNIFVNTNDGNVYEVNLTTNSVLNIAMGGSRGDFVAPDPNGTLLLTQTDTVFRLTAPSGGGFVPTPEPPSMVMGATSMLVGLVFWKRVRTVARIRASISHILESFFRYNREAAHRSTV
jgi:hypothetical protein